MIIHTKKKAKIHIHKQQEKEPKAKPDDKQRNKQIKKLKVETSKRMKGRAKNTNRKVVVNKKYFNRLKQIRENSNQSIKIKTTNLKVATATGVKTATDQLEGGKEIRESVVIAQTVATPMVKASKKTTSLVTSKAKEMAKKKIKKVEAGKKIAKRSSKKVVKSTTKNAAKNTAKKAAKETSKTIAKEVAKNTAKTVAQTTASAAGSSGGPWGLLIGTVAGKAVGTKMDIADMKAVNRNRKIRFFLDKMEPQEKQKDNIFKLLRDVIFKKITTFITVVGPLIIAALLPLILIIGAIAGVVMAVVAFAYSTPLAIFLPPLEDGTTVQDIASGYYTEFNREINTEANNLDDCDLSKIVYTNATDNYNDILAIYMVVYCNGEPGLVITDMTGGHIQTLFMDMCSYNIEYVYEDFENSDGTTTAKCVKYIYVNLKTCKDVADEYGFCDEEMEWLERLMGPDLSGY